MTILAYKDGVLASDSQLVSRTWTCIGNFEKIGRREADGRVFLFGATGETAYCSKFNEWVRSEVFDQWLKDGSGAPSLEPQGKDEQCTGFLIDEDHVCTRFEGNYPPFKLTGPFYAFGSGDREALAAMAAGADAIRAVEIAIDLDVLSNGPVQHLRMHEPSGLKARRKITR